MLASIKEYIGDIDMFLAEKDFVNFKQLESSQKEQKNTKQDKSLKQTSYNKQKNHNKKIKILHNRISKLEKKIEDFERSQKELDLQLSGSENCKSSSF